MCKTIFSLLTFLLLVTSTAAEKKVNILILGGNRHHNYKLIYGELDRKVLEEKANAKVTYTENVEEALKALKNSDIFMAVGNVIYGKAFQQELLSYLDNGGRVMFMHAGIWARKTWPLLNNDIIGGIPKGHEKGGLTFDVKIQKTSHPLMKDLPTQFEIVDELYRMTPGKNSKKWLVLATSTSRKTKETYPSIFLTKHNKGIILCCTLGHDKRSRVPAYNQFLLNSVDWLMKAKHEDIEE